MKQRTIYNGSNGRNTRMEAMTTCTVNPTSSNPNNMVNQLTRNGFDSREMMVFMRDMSNSVVDAIS